MYCDFHGHSRRHNIFMYGVETDAKGRRCGDPHILPLLLSKRCEAFSFQSCDFQ